MLAWFSGAGLGANRTKQGFYDCFEHGDSDPLSLSFV